MTKLVVCISYDCLFDSIGDYIVNKAWFYQSRDRNGQRPVNWTTERYGWDCLQNAGIMGRPPSQASQCRVVGFSFDQE